jgi:3-deoxy-7-phosphoheptulonate synthase
VHRELASGLSCPIGFKNGTDGKIRIAVDAVKAAAQPHHFLAVTKEGRSAIAATTGNTDCHIILRGGEWPNYDAAHVTAASRDLQKAGLVPAIMIDASHANSGYNPDNQPKVMDVVARQIENGNRHIIGVMIESHLVAGRQELVQGKPLRYGQSITDGCIGWDTTVEVLHRLADAVRLRRDRSQETRVVVGGYAPA